MMNRRREQNEVSRNVLRKATALSLCKVTDNDSFWNRYIVFRVHRLAGDRGDPAAKLLDEFRRFRTPSATSFDSDETNCKVSYFAVLSTTASSAAAQAEVEVKKLPRD